MAWTLWHAAPVAWALQVDPFGPPPQRPAAQQPPPVEEQDEPPPMADDPIVRAIVASDPQTPLQLARAINILLDIQAYEFAQRYLEQLAGLEPEPAEWMELERQLGPVFFLRVRQTPELAPLGVPWATRAMAAARAAATSPDRLESLVQNALSEDRRIAVAAIRDLQRVGAPGAAAAISSAVHTGEEDLDALGYVVEQLQREALEPLVGAADAPVENVRRVAVQALSRHPQPEAVETLMGIYYTEPAGSAVQAIAAQSLIRLLGRMPSAEEVEQRLKRTVEQQLASRLRPDLAALYPATLWFWDDEARYLVSRQVHADVASRWTAARRAEHLYRLAPDRAEYERLYWVAQLEAVQLSWGAARPLEADALQRLAGEISPELATGILTQSLEGDHLAAAAAAAQILKLHGRVDLRPQTRDRPAAIVQALLAGDQNLAYFAAGAIAQQPAEQSFAGAGHWLQVAVFLANSRGQRRAVIGTIWQHEAYQLGAALERMGYAVEVAATGRGVIEAATRSPDLELIIISDSLDRPAMVPLVQQLRSDWRTRRTPISVMTRGDAVDRARRLLAEVDRLQVVPWTTGEELAGTLLRPLLERATEFPHQPPPHVRLARATESIGWLVDVARHPQRAARFELAAHNRLYAQWLAVPALAPGAADLLGHIGNWQAQQALIETALRPGVEDEIRQAAVSAFDAAVQRRGIQLTIDTIADLIQLWQTSGVDPATMPALQSILDTINRRH